MVAKETKRKISDDEDFKERQPQAKTDSEEFEIQEDCVSNTIQLFLHVTYTRYHNRH